MNDNNHVEGLAMSQLGELKEFQELLSNAPTDGQMRTGEIPEPSCTSRAAPAADGCFQWTFNGHLYFPCAETTKGLPAGAYTFVMTDRGLAISPHTIVTDSIFEMPDAVNERVLGGIRKFWDSKPAFEKRGQLFKRGLLLWGPAGSGKSSTLILLARELIRRGGIVTVSDDIGLTVEGLSLIRKIERERPIVNIIEDIEEITEMHGREKVLLSLLDGEHQIDNIVQVATTNFPERLGARLAKRPSRFDEIIKVGMPSAAARKFYLEKKIYENELSPDEIDKWVADTDGMSLAFLRELLVAVFCLGRGYDETLTRLKAMQVEPRPLNEWKREPIGVFTGMDGSKSSKSTGFAI